MGALTGRSGAATKPPVYAPAGIAFARAVRPVLLKDYSDWVRKMARRFRDVPRFFFATSRDFLPTLRLKRRDLGKVGNRRNAACRYRSGNVRIADKGDARPDLGVRRVIAARCDSLPSVERKRIAGFERQRA